MVGDIISPILCMIFNTHIENETFPSSLKVAKVTPLYNAGLHTMATNYRPVSVLSPIAKVFEKIVYSRLNSFFIRNNIICEEQFGFRRGHSTSLAIVDIYSNILDNLDRKNYTCAVFLDLKKAFDAVDHDFCC